MLSLKEEIAAASVAINNIMAGVFDWLLFKLEYSNNNNNKRPFSHSFGNRYLTKVPGVSFAWYGTLLIQRKAPLTGEMSERLGSINGETSHQLGGRKLVFMV